MSRYCSHCGKARKACICQWIKSIETDVELIILQHPTEVSRSKGTAKILTLSLENSYCFQGENFSNHNKLNQLLRDPSASCLLVYPSEEAVPADRLLTHVKSQPDKNKFRLILIDGTWRKAFKIYQLSENLHPLQAIDISSGVKGNYRIRKAPSEESLSTVEAGYSALSTIDTNTDFSPLLEAFENMINFQIAQMPEGVYEKNYLQSKS